MGGINGFFAQRFVEVDARANKQRIDVYDDEDEEELVSLSPADEPPADPERVPAPVSKPEPSPEPPAVLAEEQAPPEWPDGRSHSRRSSRMLGPRCSPRPRPS